jgi:hypothetical protein
MKRIPLPEIDVAAKFLLGLFLFLALAACVAVLGGCGGALEPLPEPSMLDASPLEEASSEDSAELDASEDVDAGRRYGCVGSEAGCPDRIDHPPCIHVDGVALHCDGG